MKRSNFSIKEFLLLFFVMFVVTEGFGQKMQSDHEGKPAGELNGDFNDWGDDINSHQGWGSLNIIPFVNKESSGTEGSLAIEYFSLKRYDGGDDTWINVGPFATNVRLYKFQSTESFFGPTNAPYNTNSKGGGITLFQRHGNILTSIPGSGNNTINGWFFIGDIGPGRNYEITVQHQQGAGGPNSGKNKSHNFHYKTGTTAKLKNVSSFSVETISTTYKKVLKWTKGTNYKGSFVKYRIYKRKNEVGSTDIFIRETQGSDNVTNYSYELPDEANGEYIYSIRTVLSSSAPSDWNKNESDTEVAKTLNVSFKKTELTVTSGQNNKVRIRWKTVSDVLNLESLVLKRDGKEIAQINKSILEYTDESPIPGFKHRYELILLNSQESQLPNNGGQGDLNAYGTALKNGRIIGSVKTSTNAALSGVVVKLYNLEKLNSRSDSLNFDNAYMANQFLDSAITDNAGAYSFSNIYYHEKAKFAVTAHAPWATTKRFEVDSLIRTIDLQENVVRDVNFVDTASFIVSGFVYYPNVGGDSRIKLPVVGAKVFLDGVETGVTTDSKGFYNQAVSKVATYRMQIKVNGHSIVPESNFLTSKLDSVQTLLINKNVLLNNFVDKTLKPVHVSVAAYGGYPIGEYASLTVSSELLVPVELRQQNKVKLEHKVPYVYAADVSQNVASDPVNMGIAYKQEVAGKVNLMLPPVNFSIRVTDVQSYIEDNYGEWSTTVQPDILKKGYFDIASNGVKNFDLSLQDSIYETTGNGIKKPIDKNVAFTYFHDIKIGVDQMVNPDDEVTAFPSDLKKVVANFNNAEYNVLEQGEKLDIKFKLFHIYSYHDVDYPPTALDTGKLTITDGISDLKNAYVHNLADGELVYKLVAGQPRIESPFNKNITVVGEIAGKKAQDFTEDAIVLGERARLGTFYSRGPERTHFVLHDPPGDNSYATLQKGTKIQTSSVSHTTVSGGAGAYTDARIGFAWKTPFTQATGAALVIQANFQAGNTEENEVVENYELTLEETFSTSSDPNFVGADADIFVGASMNSTYSLTDIVGAKNLGADRIEVLIDTLLMIDSVGFGTTFVYTQHHIKEVLLPQLQTLVSLTAKDSIEYLAEFKRIVKRVNEKHAGDAVKIQADDDFKSAAKHMDGIAENLSFYRNSIIGWTNTINANERNRESAKDRILTLSGKEPGKKGAPSLFIPGGIVGKNISFSAGSSYENLVQIDSTIETSHSNEAYVTSEFGGGYYTAVSDNFNELEIGIRATVSHTNAKAQVSETSNTKTVTFHLEDDDPGDYFSVNIGSNPEFGTPVFTTVAGASSCPPEDGTQRRFIALMENEGTSVVNNVPATESAKMKVRITNRSESDEAGTYGIRLVSTSNLNGAKVLVGGQDVTSMEALYTIPTGESFVLPVEIIKGPINNEYKDITLVMYPSCEQSLSDAEKIGDYDVDGTKSFVKLSATFQHNCSEVDLFLPGNNWIINQSHQNELNVVFSKYDASETSPLQYLQLEYRRLNVGGLDGQWQKLSDPIYKKDLDQPQKQLVYKVGNLVDGDYEVRAYVSCTYGVNYSPVYVGKIDRTSALVFGLPTPSNGILTRQDIMSVEYSKNVRNDINNPIKVSLINSRTNEVIPVKVVTNGKQIQILTVDPNHLDRLENEELRASIWNVIDDQSGNLVQDTVEWGFVVSRSNLYWTPNSISINVEEGSNGLFTSTIKNKSAQNQDFSLSSYPTWITPTMRNGKVSPQGEVKIDFSIASILNTGTYVDTIRVVNDGKEQFLYLTVNVLKKAPNWQVNPGKFKYSMNVISQFSLSDANTPLSEDSFDKVAVMVNNEVRGVAHIEYDSNLGKYYAYITAYTNDLKEKLSFHFWDARPGIEYVAKEEADFVNGGVLGVVNNPYILHPKEVVQTIPLEKGWNWISLYLQNTDMGVSKVLSSLKPVNGTVINSIVNNGKMSEYHSTVGWVGSLETLNLYEGYRIYVEKADTIVWKGQFTSEAKVLPLNEGWNSLGYTMPYNVDLNTYYKDVTFAQGTRIMSQDEFAMYDSASKRWTGSLKYLRPNKGYRIETMNGNTGFGYSTYADYQLSGNAVQANMTASTLPVAASVLRGSLDPSLALTTTDYDGGMNTTYALNIGGEVVNSNNAVDKVAKMNSKRGGINKLASTTIPTVSLGNSQVVTDRYEVMTYINDELIGISKLQGLSNGEIRGFMSSSIGDSHAGQTVKFIVYDSQAKVHYTAKLSKSVQADDGNRAGSIGDPIILTLEGEADLLISSTLEDKVLKLGEELSYSVELKNVGQDAALHINLEEIIPSGFDIKAVSSERGTITKANGSWSYHLINLNREGVDRIDITVVPTRVGVYQLGEMEASVNNDQNLSNNTLYGKEVQVIDERSNNEKVFIPGLITPNGDGINDRFSIVGLNDFISEVNIVIYDKSSNVIYRNVNYQNDWDGGNFPVGSYGYHIRAKNRMGESVEFRGYVSIVR